MHVCAQENACLNHHVCVCVRAQKRYLGKCVSLYKLWQSKSCLKHVNEKIAGTLMLTKTAGT